MNTSDASRKVHNGNEREQTDANASRAPNTLRFPRLKNLTFAAVARLSARKISAGRGNIQGPRSFSTQCMDANSCPSIEPDAAMSQQAPFPFSAVVFDVFGTMVQIGQRQSPFRALMRWMRDAGRQPQPDDAARIMSQRVHLADVGKLFGMPLPDDLVAASQAALQAELNALHLFADTLRTIARLRRSRARVGVCSNLASRYGDTIISLLPPIDAYACSYEVGAINPAPAIYQHALDQLACPASEVLFIGDTPDADVDGPLKFGMAARIINRKAGQSLDTVLAGGSFSLAMREISVGVWLISQRAAGPATRSLQAHKLNTLSELR
ncbi:HAD family hydrolase [Paraburkholderia madseniana]|uniref:HAD family hydrolase n=1 Tax=Paraburkholderia madseniana TaxID=2599607 RepID=UPI0038B90988